MADGLTFEGGELLANLQKFDKLADAAIFAACSYHASRGTSWARQNAPWTDRSTNARNSLFGRADRAGRRKYRITFGHGVPYGIWLEVRFSGRYQIIKPTLQHEGPELMKTVSALMAQGWRK